MIRFVLIVPVVIAGAVSLAAQQADDPTGNPGGMPAQHPPILPQGHPPMSPPQAPTAPGVVEADPADVSTIDAIIAAYYSIVSGEKGQERDWDRFRSLFAPDARFITPRGGAAPLQLTAEQFIATNRNYFERGGYHERQAAHRTETYGRIAHVFSTYEARRSPEQEPYSRGINSIQLMGDGTRWWIITIMWDYERPDENPIPPHYLPPEPSGS
jgi:hypothetical protein